VAGVTVLLSLAIASCTPEVDQNAPPEEKGRTTAEQAGCFACHTTDGRPGTGPTWLGLFGSEVQLSDGTTVIADEEYLRRAIVEPLTEVVAGYRPVMPSGFGERLSEEEIQAIIDYIRSLS
jgi:cytochrome c oxidase subunit 2